ncbi:hypothetical protein ACOMHN_037650 [Nucella lapillus]
MAASKKYTVEEDHDFMDEVSLYNPFKKINSWETLKKKFDDHPLLGRRSSKSLRDRALLIMDQRRTLVKQQEKATPHAKYRSTSGELVEVLKTKLEAEKAAREEERQERQAEAARLQRAAEEDRQLRREELELKKRELDLREAQEKAMAKEREAMMQLLMQQLSKK